MRFYTSGTNWDGQRWVLCPAGRVLVAQIEAADPERTLVDGTVASKQHDINNPDSDHSPDADGIVRGVDHGGAADLLERQFQTLCASKDIRVKYQIHNGRIWSNYPRNGYEPFTIRPYSGSSTHKRHIHTSIDKRYDTIVGAFDLGGSMPVERHTHPLSEIQRVADLTQPGKVFEKDWDWFLQNGIGSSSSDPTDIVQTQQFAAFLKRYNDRVIRPQILGIQQLIESIEVGQPADIEAIAAQLKLASTEIQAVL